MKYLYDLFFRPPPMPNVDLPLPAKMLPAIKVTLETAFKLAYERGVLDGVAVTLLAVTMIAVFRRKP